jgi:hypothetical protein
LVIGIHAIFEVGMMARVRSATEDRPTARAPKDAFREALAKLANDRDFRDNAQAEPDLLLKDFPELGLGELQALRQVAVMSGADVSNVDNVLWNQMHLPAKFLEPVPPAFPRPGPSEVAGGVHIHCCCCCCCCGETAIVLAP